MMKPRSLTHRQIHERTTVSGSHWLMTAPLGSYAFIPWDNEINGIKRTGTRLVQKFTQYGKVSHVTGAHRWAQKMGVPIVEP